MFVGMVPTSRGKVVREKDNVSSQEFGSMHDSHSLILTFRQTFFAAKVHYPYQTFGEVFSL